MDFQEINELAITEGDVRTIHDSDGNLLWGKLEYDTQYGGDASQSSTPTPQNPVNVDIATGTQTITLTGKNLFNRSEAEEDKLLAWVTGTTSNENGSIVSDYIPVEINKAMKFTYNAQVMFYDSTKSYLGALQTDGVSIAKSGSGGGNFNQITVPNNTSIVYMRLGFRKPLNPAGVDLLTADIQVEYGSTATTYEPYQSGTYTLSLGSLELCKIGDYQDYIYKSGDDWYILKAIAKVTLNGDESWNKTNVSFQTTADVTSGINFSPSMNAYSNYFVHHYYSSGISSNIQNGEFGWSSLKVLTIRNDDCVDATAFKTWLSSHNTNIYYPLDTQTDTQITDTNLIGQLNELHQFLTRYGYQASVSGSLPIIINQTQLT